MELTTITYLGRLVAVATPTRFILNDELEDRPRTDPERRFVTWMCAYAWDIHAGRSPGPYTEQRARAFVRGALIPGELLERPELDVPRAAAALGVPERELDAARNDQTLLRLRAVGR